MTTLISIVERFYLPHATNNRKGKMDRVLVNAFVMDCHSGPCFSPSCVYFQYKVLTERRELSVQGADRKKRASAVAHQDSNLDLWFRKPLFYPLNYGANDLTN